MVTPGIPVSLMDKLATVYSEDGTTGAFSVVAKTGLKCHLAIVSASGARTNAERAELAAMRRLFWDPSYDLSERTQLEIDGARWNVVQGTMVAPEWPMTGDIVYRACDVIRAL